MEDYPGKMPPTPSNVDLSADNFVDALIAGYVEASQKNATESIRLRKVAGYAFRWRCEDGHLDVAKRLAERFGLTVGDAQSKDNYALRRSCANGHLDVAKWLTERFGLTAEDVRSNGNYALIKSCKNGHLDVAKWLTERFGLQ